jgi:hypothetical protein
MITQYCCTWYCAKCGHCHNFWVNACNLKNLTFKCKTCKHVNDVNYTIREGYLNCYVNPATLPKMSVQEFVKLLPQKPNPYIIENSIKTNPNFSKHGLSVEQSLDIWSIHDALHYITGIGFTSSQEEYIRYLEEKLDIGWYSISPELNTMSSRSFNFAPIDKEKIMEVAKEIRTCLEDQY